MTANNTPTDLTPVARICSEIIRNDHLQTNTTKLKHRLNPGLRLLSIRSVAITPDNKYLIITHEYTSQIKVIDLTRLELMPFKYNSHITTVRLVSPAPDSTSFYTASWDGCFMHYNIIDGSHKILFCGTRSPSVFLDPNQKYLFTAEYPEDSNTGYNIGRCWDMNKKRTIAIYKMKRKVMQPQGVDIAYDQKHVFVGCDGTVIKFDLSGKKQLIKYFDIEIGVRKIAISENFVAAASNNGILRIFRKNGEHHLHIEVSKYEVKDIKIVQDESLIVCANDDGTIRCLSLKTGKERFSCKAHKSGIWSCCLANNDQIIVSGGTDGLISFIDIRTGKIILQMYNLKQDNEFVATVPPDKNFPNGFFYTSDKDFIDVYAEEENNTINVLENTDYKRQAYINKLNCKNLVLNKIKPKSQYDELVNKFFRHRPIQSELKFQEKIKSIGC